MMPGTCAHCCSVAKQTVSEAPDITELLNCRVMHAVPFRTLKTEATWTSREATQTHTLKVRAACWLLVKTASC